MVLPGLHIDASEGSEAPSSVIQRRQRFFSQPSFRSASSEPDLYKGPRLRRSLSQGSSHLTLMAQINEILEVNSVLATEDQDVQGAIASAQVQREDYMSFRRRSLVMDQHGLRDGHTFRPRTNSHDKVVRFKQSTSEVGTSRLHGS